VASKYDKDLSIIPHQDVKLQLSDRELNIVQDTRITEVGETKVYPSWHSIVLSGHSHTYADKVSPKQHTWDTLIAPNPQKGNGK